MLKRTLSLLLVTILSLSLSLIVAPGRPALADSDTWEWQNPLPQGNLLGSVWASSSSDIFAVGEVGTIIHFDGSTWTPMDSSTTEVLWGVWGSSGTDVFAVGASGTTLHYNGTGWSPMTSGTTRTLSGVWGSSGSDVFAVGAGGTIRHYDGAVWSSMTSGTPQALAAVWGTSGSDVFAVGDDGTILHYGDGMQVVMSSLTMAVSGSGTTTPPVGAHSYEEGTVVEISANPAAGWGFESWTGSVADTNSQNTTVTVNGDMMVTANFAQIPSAFVASNLNITPTEVAPGQRVSHSVLVTNAGDTTGSYQVVLRINGEIMTIANVTLAGGSSARLGYGAEREVPGTYVVDVNGLTGTFVVRQAR